MPCLEISMPRVDSEIKKKLADELTRVFTDTAGYDPKIFGIRFHEYDPGAAASGGKICDGGPGRPYLHFLLYCPRLKRAVKQALVSRFSERFAACLGQPEWKPVIHICEHPYDNVGVNGDLLSESFAELADKRFYYDTADE